jgi:hypothetical protein
MVSKFVRTPLAATICPGTILPEVAVSDISLVAAAWTFAAGAAPFGVPIGLPSSTTVDNSVPMSTMVASTILYGPPMAKFVSDTPSGCVGDARSDFGFSRGLLQPQRLKPACCSRMTRAASLKRCPDTSRTVTWANEGVRPPSSIQIAALTVLVAAAEVVNEHLFDGLVVGHEDVADGVSADDVADFFGEIFGVVAGAFERLRHEDDL